MATSNSVKSALASKNKKKTGNWTYQSKYEKKIDKNYLKYITNTKVPLSQQKLSPKNHEDAGISHETDRKLRFNLNMISGKGIHADNINRYFDRLYSVYPQYEMDNLCQYVFIVRPDLNILTDNTNMLVHIDNSTNKYLSNSSPDKDFTFQYMRTTHKYLMSNLSGNDLNDHDFMPFLVGKASSMNIADYTLKDHKLVQPFSGFNLPYASNALESLTGGTFDLTFREDGDFRIHKLFYCWTYYIDGLMRNIFSPKLKYIRQNRFDYMSSIYCITCKANATEIVYWTKYTGCFPLTTPHSDLSFNLRGQPKNDVTIPFAYFRQESLNPFILIDFNKNSHVLKDMNKQPYIPIYRSATIGGIGLKDLRDKNQKKLSKDEKFYKSAPAVLGSGNGLVGAPFVCKSGIKYYLRWKTIKNISP